MLEEIKKAEDLLRKGRYPKAIEILRGLLTDDPDNGELRARVAEAYRLSGNLERAFHHFNKSAQLYGRRGDVVTAFQMLKAANTVSPNEPDILFRMAECLKTMGSHTELELVLRQLVGVARAVGDRRRLWALEELVQIHPDDLEVAVQRAAALSEAGRIDDAVTAWKQVSAHLEVLGVDYVPMLHKAAEVAAERPDVGVDLADVLLVARKPRDALSLLVPFYEKYPEDIGVLGALVKALEQLGAVDKVVPARIELIKARVKRGHRELAFSEVARLMEVAPNNPLALEVSAHTYSTFGFRGDASKLWRRLIQLHEQQGRIPERDRAIVMLLKVNPDDPEALSMGARSLRDAGRSAEAEALERKLREVHRASKEASLPAAPLERAPVRQDRSEGGAQEPRQGRGAARVLETPPLADPPTDAVVPAQPKERHASATVMLDDADLVGEIDEYPSDAFASEEFSDPEPEPLPIAHNPYAKDLDLEGRTGPLPPVHPEEPDDPDMIPTRATQQAYHAPEYNLPEERPSDAEETTSRMEVSDELQALRRAFDDEDSTNMDDERFDEDPTLPPPDDFEEFTSRTRSQLVSDLLRETTKGES